ncbi:hypothetical protein [Demequina aurantiaca]
MIRRVYDDSVGGAADAVAPDAHPEQILGILIHVKASLITST